MKLILASASPRRRQYLSDLGLRFEVVPPSLDEELPAGASPAEAARELALAKAREVAGANPDAAVLAADTIVELDGVILGKPGDDGEGRRMLAALSGRGHNVHTGVALLWPGGELARCVTTQVVFARLRRAEIEWYVATGEGRDKAGGYGIQGLAAGFVREVRGSYTGVVGLPLAETFEMLEEPGLTPWTGHD